MDTIIKDLWSGVLTIEPREAQTRITVKSKSTGEVSASVDLSPEDLSDLIDRLSEGRRRLPSRHQIGDRVKVVLNDSGEITNAEIIKVHFTESKVFYDLVVFFHYAKPADEGQPVEYQEDMTGATRLYNVDSCFVHPAA